MKFSDQLKTDVKNKYLERYPSWTEIRITEIILNSDNSYFLAIKAKENGVEPQDEICFVGSDNQIKIFSTTEELISFIGNQQNKKWYNQLTSKAGISAVVTIVLLCTLSILVFLPEKSDKAVLQILGAAFMGAIGFLFGTTASNKST